MKFRIYGTYAGGDEDSFIVEGSTIEEIREKAFAEEAKRGWTNCWSEEL